MNNQLNLIKEEHHKKLEAVKDLHEYFKIMGFNQITKKGLENLYDNFMKQDYNLYKSWARSTVKKNRQRIVFCDIYKCFFSSKYQEQVIKIITNNKKEDDDNDSGVIKE